MDATKQRAKGDHDSYEHFSADDDDLKPRIRRNSPTNSSNIYRNVFTLLLVVVMGAYVLNRHNPLTQLALRPAFHQAPVALGASAASNPVPPIYTADALLPLKPLTDCIKPDNIIDEAVATCRYGQFPRASQNDVAQSMVSASYLAKYKADQLPARTKRLVAQNIERDVIWQWDGKRTYAAEWMVLNNRIEGSSVCANYRRGSIEYRECRKGAKVYFREKCREWSTRANKAGTDSSRVIEQRFCSAGDDFNPLD